MDPQADAGLASCAFAKSAATRERLDVQLLELTPPLATLSPPATIIDKTRYSAFAETGLIEHLRQREADALIVSGSRDRCLCDGDRAGRG